MVVTPKTVGYIVGGIVLAVMLVFVVAVGFPWLAGGDAAYIVTSDSMSPTIESGDVIITREIPSGEIESGDVVTFNDGSGTDTGYVTHRVVDIVVEDGERYFEVQGDANDDPDEGLVPAEYVEGVLLHHIPYLGYLLLFARSGLGLFVLVVLPGLLLVASGGWQLLREFGYTPNGQLLESTLLEDTSAAASAEEEPETEPVHSSGEPDSNDGDATPGERSTAGIEPEAHE